MILDLPPAERTPDQLSLISEQRTVNFKGIDVRYIFGTMDNLQMHASQSFDLVWSGQSVEHISIDQARRMLSEVNRVLQPGGSFCLDTPNRNLSKMLCRLGYIHPEHKTEYTPESLRNLLLTSGFTIKSALAVSPMPMSLNWKRFCKLELHQASAIGDQAVEGFSFFFHCKKPMESHQ